MNRRDFLKLPAVIAFATPVAIAASNPQRIEPVRIWARRQSAEYIDARVYSHASFEEFEKAIIQDVAAAVDIPVNMLKYKG